MSSGPHKTSTSGYPPLSCGVEAAGRFQLLLCGLTWGRRRFTFDSGFGHPSSGGQNRIGQSSRASAARWGLKAPTANRSLPSLGRAVLDS